MINMDGVIYHGDDMLPGVDRFFAFLQVCTKQSIICFYCNNHFCYRKVRKSSFFLRTAASVLPLSSARKSRDSQDLTYV